MRGWKIAHIRLHVLSRSMDRVNESVLNYDLIEDVLRLLLFPDGKITHGLVAPDGVDISQGSILIFLPGLAEIVTLSDRLKGSRVFGTRRLDIIPLHSSLSSQDQRKAFQSPHDGRRKVIIATNIAETSGTSCNCDLLYFSDSESLLTKIHYLSNDP